MKYNIIKEFPNDFLLKPEGKAVSLYQTTHPSAPDSDQDAIRFKNLVKDLNEQAAECEGLADDLKQCLEDLTKDKQFWLYNSHGLALFADAEQCYIYRLNTDMPDLAYFGDNFYLLPLLTYFDALDHAYVLSFDRKEFKILEGDQTGLSEVDLNGEYVTEFKELYPDIDADSNLNFGSYGGNQSSYHGHRARAEEVEKDKEKFFRHIDHVLSDVLSPHDPIILLGLSQHQADFRKMVKNNNVLDKGIEKPYSSMSEKEVLEAVSTVLAEARQEHLKKQGEIIDKAFSALKYLSDLKEIEDSIAEGRVDTLFISEDLNNSNPGHELLKKINKLTFEVLEKGGHFYVLPQELLKGDNKFAAVLRY